MEDSLGSSQSTELASRQRDSTYGVESLADTLEAAFGQDSKGPDKTADGVARMLMKEKEKPRRPSQSSSKASSGNSESSLSSPARKHKRKTSNNTLSTPLTPLNVDARSPTPAPAMPSSPKSVSVQSLKLSDEESTLDESNSQVVTSSGEEEYNETQQGASNSFPELVMPSIQMPRRRPFTDKGRAMGKLKVLFAGETGKLDHSNFMYH
jgi:hypothetical protein